MIINLHLVHKVSFCFVLLYFHLSSEICHYIKFIIGISLNEQEEIKPTDFNNRKIRLFLTQHATQQLVMLISCIDYCCRVWHTIGPMCGPRWCIWSPNTWSGPTLTSSPSCWSTEYQHSYLNSLVGVHLPLIFFVPHMSTGKDVCTGTPIQTLLIPWWWDDLQMSVRRGAIPSSFKKLLKTQLFWEHLFS